MNKIELIKKLQQAQKIINECLVELSAKIRIKETKKAPFLPNEKMFKGVKVEDINFDMPLRPFVKKYGKGMSGPKKFTLLVARLAKGDLKKEIALFEVQKHWNKMKAKTLLGMKFNRFYPGRAKDNDLVESRRKGFYNLRPSWVDIFKK